MTKQTSYKLIFEKNLTEISESVDPNHVGQGMARGFLVIYPYIALLSLFEYGYKRIFS